MGLVQSAPIPVTISQSKSIKSQQQNQSPLIGIIPLQIYQKLAVDTAMAGTGVPRPLLCCWGWGLLLGEDAEFGDGDEVALLDLAG